MRYREYIIAEDGVATRELFTEEHYRIAGFAYTPDLGLPILEAHQLVNQFNAHADDFGTAGTYRYWLPI